VETDKTVVIQVFLVLGVQCLIAVIFLIATHYMTLGRAAQYAAEKKAKSEKDEPEAFANIDKILENDQS